MLQDTKSSSPSRLLLCLDHPTLLTVSVKGSLTVQRIKNIFLFACYFIFSLFVVTDAEQRMFDVLLGPFLYDTELVNMTFATGVITVAEASASGINVLEQRFQNGSKAFRLQVRFSDSFVISAVSV